MDQTAPPPYSETDIFSNTNTTIPTPTTTEADDASRVNGRARSDSSSTDNSLIYTPPYSPTEPDDQHSENDRKNLSPNNYFESRPLPPQYSAPRTTQHEICVTPRSTPVDIPIPSSASDYGIIQQDWSTFVNYLLPDHTLNVNNDVADRKLKAELIDERMHRLTLSEHDYSRLDMNEVQAQLRPLRHPVTASNTDWIRQVDEVIQTWNLGFFLPRGLEIIRIDLEQPELFRERDSSMPGSWIPDEEESRFPERNRSRRGFLGCCSPCGQGVRGFRLGSMVADDEGFRIGRNGIVADSNGLRIGNMFVADDKGLRVGGNRGIVADEHGLVLEVIDLEGGGEEVCMRRGSIEDGNKSQKGGMGGTDGEEEEVVQTRRITTEDEGTSLKSITADAHNSITISKEENREIIPPHLPHPHPAPPLPDDQLPAAKESLLEWLHHPEYPMTKQTSQKIKHDIQPAKNKDKNKNKKNPDPNIANSASRQDLANLRKEVADLLRKFNDEQKSQKTIRKILRKEQRGLKKAHRKERKNTRKAERKGAKRDKKERKKMEKKCNKRDFPHILPSAPTPTYPNIPEIPNARFPPLPHFPVPTFHAPFPGAQNPNMATMKSKLALWGSRWRAGIRMSGEKWGWSGERDEEARSGEAIGGIGGVEEGGGEVGGGGDADG
ncbi:hypothetical protein H4I96_05655 [Botrytis cinerea]